MSSTITSTLREKTWKREKTQFTKNIFCQDEKRKNNLIDVFDALTNKILNAMVIPKIFIINISFSHFKNLDKFQVFTIYTQWRPLWNILDNFQSR